MRSRSQKRSSRRFNRQSTFRLVIEYDGTDYYGWQRQSRAPSVQGELEKAVSRIAGRPVSVIGSGRTDRGVHAIGQVAHFRAPMDLSRPVLLRALNANLPNDICVKAIQRVKNGFHARYDARRKTYRYTIHNAPLHSPLLARTTWHVPGTLNLARMRRAARFLKGRHDFRSFQRTGSKEMVSTVRLISRIDIQYRKPQITVVVSANGFLYNMARIVVGLLVEIGRQSVPVEHARELLKARDRRAAPKAAPAHGLCLIKVDY